MLSLRLTELSFGGALGAPPRGDGGHEPDEPVRCALRVHVELRGPDHALDAVDERYHELRYRMLPGISEWGVNAGAVERTYED